MSGFFTILVLLLGFGLLVVYMRKMQQGGFTRSELRQLATRGWIGGILLVALILVASSIVAVPVGERMVVYNLVTRGFRQPLEPGYGFVLPLINERVLYDVRTQDYTMSGTVEEGQVHRADAIQVLSSDGLKMDLDITVLFHADPEGLNDLHSTVGPDYVAKIIRPTVREAIRNKFAEFEATEAYSSSRKEIQDSLEDVLRTALAGYEVVLDEGGVKLRNIDLPPTVVSAIEEKKAAQQQAEQMQYVLEKEEKEKERIKIEAEAQADKIDIINQQLATSPNYLNWLAIDKLNEDIQLVVTDGDTLLNLDAIKAH